MKIKIGKRYECRDSENIQYAIVTNRTRYNPYPYFGWIHYSNGDKRKEVIWAEDGSYIIGEVRPEDLIRDSVIQSADVTP